MLTENTQDPNESSVEEYSSLIANLHGVAKQATRDPHCACLWFEGSCPLSPMNHRMQTLSLQPSISSEPLSSSLLKYLGCSTSLWIFSKGQLSFFCLSQVHPFCLCHFQLLLPVSHLSFNLELLHWKELILCLGVCEIRLLWTNTLCRPCLHQMFCYFLLRCLWFFVPMQHLGLHSDKHTVYEGTWGWNHRRVLSES